MSRALRRVSLDLSMAFYGAYTYIYIQIPKSPEQSSYRAYAVARLGISGGAPSSSLSSSWMFNRILRAWSTAVMITCRPHGLVIHLSMPDLQGSIAVYSVKLAGLTPTRPRGLFFFAGQSP